MTGNGRDRTKSFAQSCLAGGYDPELNQIVVCYNRCGAAKTMGVLTHELIHMYDYCRAEMDFNNLEHIACSEVSAFRFRFNPVSDVDYADSCSKFGALFVPKWLLRRICVAVETGEGTCSMCPSKGRGELISRSVDSVGFAALSE